MIFQIPVFWLGYPKSKHAEFLRKSPVYLKDVEEFRRDVAQNYSLRQWAVLLVALGKGSVMISILVPVSAESQIKSTEPEFFKKHKITKMVFNGSFITSEVSNMQQNGFFFCECMLLFSACMYHVVLLNLFSGCTCILCMYLCEWVTLIIQIFL